jgi:hypothetical protein
MSEVQKKQTNLREKLAELLDFRKMRDRLSGLGLYIGKDRTNTDENLLVRGGANVDDLQLAEISAAVGGTAVDVFVYDTSRDSDGGKWRERTQNTSWYNEELNTATRGARREFPAVAVIVAESGNVKKLKIYDGDDPDLPLWMSFEASGLGSALGRSSNAIFGISSVCVLNGLLCVTGLGSGGNIETLCQISFIDDVFWQWHKYGFGDAGISERNEAHSVSTQEYRGRINEPINVGGYNDVAMTVLPNAPVDPATGLPTPTIAVACGDGSSSGFSIINHDGTVANKSYIESAKSQSVSFTSDNRLVVSQKRNSNGDIWVAIYDNLTTSTSTTGVIVHDPNISVKYNDINYLNLPNILSRTTGTIGDKYIMSENGLTLIDEGETYVDDDGAKIYGMAAYATSKYNTGWMPGDIKLAALSDSVVETVGVSSDELVVDGSGNWVGNFNVAGDLDSWTDIVNGNYSIVSGELFIDYVDTTSPGVYIDINVVAGRRYILSVTSRSSTAGQPTKASFQDPNGLTITYLGGEWSGFNRLENDTTSNVDQVGVFSVESSGVIRLRLQSNSTTNAYFDNISVRATTELITNGDFSIDVTGWSSTSGASISHDTTEYAGGALQINQNSSSGQGAYQSINTIIGQSYVLNVIGKGDSIGNLSNLVIEIGTSIMGSELGGQMVGSGSVEGNVSITFVASSTITYISLGPTGSDTRVAYVDNISVRPAEEDRSVNSNGLQIFGEIQKTPVAPGADLVAYSGFSANDYLVQPYNEDLDFGTGDFCVMGWFKQSPTTNFHNYLSRGGRINVYVDAATSLLNFRVTDGTIFMNCLSTSVIDNDTWTFFVGVKSDGTTYNYINGKLEQTANYRQVGSLDGEFITHIGRSHNPSDPRPADTLALWRISATAPTPEQIAKIYRDEKPLFQQGAQATLYGTSDAVTALAYDQKTELLHVGTASGRSDFSGLRRINNTTTAITTSISAHNNLIAEQ